ncbi:MAG: DNA recombination protein RmuC [Bergeyella sp.]|nr:DNA recombination protein RmuC [Bergeyella sp.]
MFFVLGGWLVGLLLGSLLTYFVTRVSRVSRKKWEGLNALYIKARSNLENTEQKNRILENGLESERSLRQKQLLQISEQNEKLAKIFAEKQSVQLQLTEQKENTKKLQIYTEKILEEKQQIFAQNAELSAQNEALKGTLSSQKEEITKLQEQAKIQFENLATKILEEKSEKFTTLNSLNLKNILEPFQEKITELKNRVNEAYEKENKERFSLAEKVKELAELNQQISKDAKNLTKALKGETKTQGNWGEMILENILEKSGLEKGREYFLQQEIRDENNAAVLSEAGKKMRPDAIVKYPGNRNLIIDSKVSLTAFSELSEETDKDTHDLKLNKHLSSVKRHIDELSNKSYDDDEKSLDFVMMFIPSEAAYIAAMQADPNLWHYAYRKRILLLNPSNLITSLKLVSDLWKREYQNKNAMDIAERGAKLYDKFVGFTKNLEKVGKNIDQAKTAYNESFSQLATGRDNLITQTLKLKKLGIKNKKEIPQSFVNKNIESLNQNSTSPL